MSSWVWICCSGTFIGFVYLFAWALCRVAGLADQAMERIMRKRNHPAPDGSLERPFTLMQDAFKALERGEVSGTIYVKSAFGSIIILD